MDVEQLARAASALKDVWVISVPDCLPVASWSRRNEAPTEEAAVRLGSLYRRCQEALKWSDSMEAPRWVTIEAEDTVMMLARSAPDLVTVMAFERRVPLGLMRMQARQVLERVASETGIEPDPLRRDVEALLERIRARSPEPRAALAHLARTAGVDAERLARPDTLARDQLRAILEASPRDLEHAS